MKLLDDWMREYYNQLPKNRTYQDAYEATEAKYLEKYTHRRYASYSVFRSALSRWLSEGRQRS